MQLSVNLPPAYKELVIGLLRAEGFEENPEGLNALVRSSLKDHGKTLINLCLDKGKFEEAQNLVREVNQINQHFFPPATAKATQLIFTQRTKKGQSSWEVKELYIHKGPFYESINPDGTPGKKGIKEKGSLTERIACEVLV